MHTNTVLLPNVSACTLSGKAAGGMQMSSSSSQITTANVSCRVDIVGGCACVRAFAGRAVEVVSQFNSTSCCFTFSRHTRFVYA